MKSPMLILSQVLILAMTLNPPLCVGAENDPVVTEEAAAEKAAAEKAAAENAAAENAAAEKAAAEQAAAEQAAAEKATAARAAAAKAAADKAAAEAEEAAAKTEPPADEPKTRSILTTHVVHLRNGHPLKGDLLPSSPTDPLQLRVGGFGVIEIERGRVLRVEESAGQIELPAMSSAQPVHAPAPFEDHSEPEVVAGLTLDELVDGVIALRHGGGPESSVDPEVARRAQLYTYELSRHRTQNRVRAERHLVALGADVLPFLESVAQHPFALTRRGVQRIIRELGDRRGAPLAIRALGDDDEFVRELAGRALRTLFTDKIRYRAHWSEARRARAQQAYWELWLDHERTQLKSALTEVLGLDQL